MRLALVLTLDEERENNEKQRRGEGKMQTREGGSPAAWLDERTCCGAGAP
jgi:hypothetical protein